MKRAAALCIPLLAFAVAALGITQAAAAAPAPNIVVILADDLGYGDISCLNPASKIRTPHLDRLAATGMIFTDARSPSAVCTPTRYGILTGRYAWRTRLKRGVLNGFSPPLLEPGRLTIARVLKQQGYSTACIGKWHLGLRFTGTNGSALVDKQPHEAIDYRSPLADGPREHGFDYSFIIPASLDMPPYVYIRDGQVAAPPTDTMQDRQAQR